MAEKYRRVLRRRAILLAVVAFCLTVSFLANVFSGPAALSIAEVVAVIVDPDAMSAGLRVILWDVRLPVATMAVLVGACLGLAGAEMQTVLSNPLASPATLGLSHAATVGASFAIAFGLAGPFGMSDIYIAPVFAFAGALLSMALIQFLSRVYGASLEIVILFGIAMVFALEALISLIQFVSDSDSLQQIVFWTMGSLARATWDKIAVIALVLAFCSLWSATSVWKLTVLRGGESVARSAGIAVERVRLISLLRVSVLAAVAVAFTGVIGFVGLVAPHISRLLVGEDHRFYLPGSALIGGLLLSAASVAAKSVVPGILIPDGIVTAMVGVPMFVALIILQRKRGP